jgi:hypothetical protein
MENQMNEDNIQADTTETEGQQSAGEQMQPVSNTSQVVEDQSSHTGRKIAVSILVISGLLLLMVANLAFWARYTVLNTNGWVNAVGPLTQDPEIAQVLGIYVSGEIFEATDMDQAVTEILPAEFQLLSLPLSKAMQGLVEDAVATFIQSDVVNSVWVTTNRIAHSLIVGVLRGEGDILYLVDEDGRIVLLENQQVAYLQQVVSLLDAIGILLPLLSLAVFVIAVFVSLWRRKTTLWIGIGIVITMVLSLLVYKVAESWLLVSIADPLLRIFGGAIWGVITNGLIMQIFVLMVIGILIIFGAWVAGSSRTAGRIRTTVRGWTNR